MVLGDGRLSLERVRRSNSTVLGIDAFAGDSIPMHLVTREAMALYVRHLAKDGVIVFQATNRYIESMPVVKRLASEFEMQAVLVSDVPAFKTGRRLLVVGDRSDSGHAQQGAVAVRRSALCRHADRGSRDLPTFTDAHHNMFRVLK